MTSGGDLRIASRCRRFTGEATQGCHKSSTRVVESTTQCLHLVEQYLVFRQTPGHRVRAGGGGIDKATKPRSNCSGVWSFSFAAFSISRYQIRGIVNRMLGTVYLQTRR